MLKLGLEPEKAGGKIKEWSYDFRNVVTTVTYDGGIVLSKPTDPGNRCSIWETFGNRLARSIGFVQQDNAGAGAHDKVIGIGELGFDYSYAADKSVKRETNPSGVFAPLGLNLIDDDGSRAKTWNRVADCLIVRDNQNKSSRKLNKGYGVAVQNSL